MDNTFNPSVEITFADAPRQKFPWPNVALFFLTCGSTVIVGTFLMAGFTQTMSNGLVAHFLEIWRRPSLLLTGLPFSIAIMTILLAHEMGHYLTCRYYRISASLPYFIPAPTIVGTMGAFIRIRSAIHHRAALLEIGIAGPIAGFLFAIPTLFIALAQSRFLDGPLLVSILPPHVIYNMFILGYSDYWEGTLSRRVAELCNIVAIDPNANLIRAMQVGAVGLKHNRVLLIFPEGTRSIDGRLADFKKGSAILAYELGVPIVPVGIRGTFESWPRGGSFRFHPVQIHLGKPVDPRAFAEAEDPYSAITARVQEEVKQLAGLVN